MLFAWLLPALRFYSNSNKAEQIKNGSEKKTFFLRDKILAPTGDKYFNATSRVNIYFGLIEASKVVKPTQDLKIKKGKEVYLTLLIMTLPVASFVLTLLAHFDKEKEKLTTEALRAMQEQIRAQESEIKSNRKLKAELETLQEEKRVLNSTLEIIKDENRALKSSFQTILEEKRSLESVLKTIQEEKRDLESALKASQNPKMPDASTLLQTESKPNSI